MHQTLTQFETQHCQYPHAVYTENASYVVWTETQESYDVIVLLELHTGKKIVLSEKGKQALKATAWAKNDDLYVIYSSSEKRKWKVLLQHIKAMQVVATYCIAEGESELYPVLQGYDAGLFIAWTSQNIKESRILGRTLNNGVLSESRCLSDSRKAYRPSLALLEDGQLVLAYDRFNGTSYDIIVRRISEESLGEELQVNDLDGRWAASPTIVPVTQGALIGWYDIYKGASFSFKSSRLVFQAGFLAAEKPQELAGAMDWYQNISLASDGEVAAFAYTWGKNNIHVRILDDMKTWSDPVIMSLNDTNCAVHPHIAVNKNSVDLVWQFALKNGHQQYRNAQIYYSTLSRKEFLSHTDISAEEKQVQFTLPIPTPKSFPSPSKESVQIWLEENSMIQLNPYFGDIHGQSGISDGMGEIDQYFHYAKAGANLDFTALTDHDCYPDWMSPSEWEWIRTTTRLHNQDGELTTLLSYEWTPNEYRYDYGHKNVYYPGDEGEVLRSGDYDGMTPDRLFSKVKEYKAMAFPHHPAATWTMVSAATDWAFHDEDVQRQVEIFSRHAPFEFYGNHSIYTKNNPQLKDCSVQDALDLGYHMGFTAGSDSHQLEHGIEGGIIGMLLPALNRKEVFKALYDRATWATTGVRMLIALSIDTHQMGSIVKKEEGQRYILKASVLGTTELKVELLRNNQVVHTLQSQSEMCTFTYEDTKTEEAAFYYLRITQNDEHQGWSSPIWVES